METYQKIEEIICPKCESREVEQVGNSPTRYIFKCKKCNKYWGKEK